MSCSRRAVFGGPSAEFCDTVTKSSARTWHTRDMSRPRSRAIDDRIAAAAAALIADGARPITISAVAARAGVSRPTVYRRWPSINTLLFELQTQASVPSEMPDLGSVHAELTLAVTHLVATMVGADRRVLASQTAAMIADPAFARGVHERRWHPDRDRVYEIWQRAVDRGEVSAAVDGREVLDDIVGVCHFRVLLLHRAPDPEAIAELVGRLISHALLVSVGGKL